SMFSFHCFLLPRDLHSFPTRRSSDLVWAICFKWNDVTGGEQGYPNVPMPSMAWLEWIPWVGDLKIDHKFFYLTLILAALSIAAIDRKSTRLNSSHLVISYAVFCLKKK